MRPMYGALGKAVGTTCLAFMSKAAVEKGKAKEYGLEKTAVAVQGCRTVTKKDMKFNAALPVIKVDPETYEVTADGVPLTCLPSEKLPLTQNYFLF